MMKGLAVAVLLVAACSSPPKSASTASVPASASRSLGTAPVPSSTQSPAPVAVTVAALSCRLPIAWGVNASQGYVRKFGFLNFRDGTVTEDPGAPAASSFYDRAFARWLPVDREAVSNDGRRYAYTTGSAYQDTAGTVHVVDLASGADRTLFSGKPIYRVVSFAPEGIYLTLQAPEGRSRGLWIQDPAGGSARLLNRDVVDPWVAGGAGWGVDFDASDPNPAPGGIESPFNRLVQIDLYTGATTPWFTWLGADIWVDGVDYSGNPFVELGRPAPSDPGTETLELWFITGKGTGQRLFAGPMSQPWPDRLSAIENHGAWFQGGSSTTSPSTVWLYSSGAMRVAATVNLDSVTVAGGCIDS
jgi:hypothetical protein